GSGGDDTNAREETMIALPAIDHDLVVAEPAIIDFVTALGGLEIPAMLESRSGRRERDGGDRKESRRPVSHLFRRFRLRRQLRGVFGAFERELGVAFDSELLVAAKLSARPGRDQAPDDDVFLQALERVRLAVGSGLGEHA